MTLEELKQYDGKDGRPVYVAYKGKVYDLTKSDFWAGGTHMGMITAGQDLTSSIHLSPHGEANLFRYPVVAELTEEAESAKEETKTVDPKIAKQLKYQELYRKFHPHPIMVHFSMGIYPFAFLMQAIAFIIGGELGAYFSFTSVASMVCATLFAIPAILSGIVSLVINYNGKPNIYLKRKIILSCLLVAIGFVGSVMGITEQISDHIGYTLTTLAATAIVLGIGYNGGKITWPN